MYTGFPSVSEFIFWVRLRGYCSKNTLPHMVSFNYGFRLERFRRQGFAWSLKFLSRTL